MRCHEHCIHRPVDQQTSISSRLRPLVSGTPSQTNSAATTQTNAYTRNAPGAVSTRTSERKVRVTMRVPHHKLTVEIDMACPRTRVGLISDISTQVPVPIPTAKQAT